jgi:DNA mismatch repair protein MutL
MPIKILPDEVASQIAAGEVVERPASVVKELIENAIDAGATAIQIRCEGAGQKLILIQDNGHGIPADELNLAVTRHATSKLTTAQDLFQVDTLGFRGEALASIGSVSQMTVNSRQAQADIGARIRVDGGISGGVESLGMPVGTEIQVENLFFNVPARRKFLKTDLTERRQIDEVVSRYALAFPHIRFSLSQEGKISLQTTGSGNRREILAALFGVEIAEKMLEVLAVEDRIKIEGLISPASITRSNRKAIQFFVNGRPVQEVALTAALLQGYHTLLMSGRYPIAQIFLDIPVEWVDVNVHPTKAEVRFQDRDRVFAAVQRAIRRALLAYTPVPELRNQYRWQIFPDAPPSTWGVHRQEEVNFDDDKATELPVAEEPLEGDDGRQLPGVRVPLLRLVGQVAATYLIAEGPDGLYLIDQHAAHERVLYEKFLAQKANQISSQRLLEVIPVELPPASSRLLEEQLPMLVNLGFEVESFGRNTFLVRAIPSLLSGIQPADALRVVVEDFEEDETPLQGKIEEKLIARVCKRAAVKAGQVLTPEEQRALLLDLEKTVSPRTCPHGRPTMIHLSVDLLERQFGRRGAR